LLGDKAVYADGPDALEICEHAYPVFCAVAVIKMQQIGAGIIGAGPAELMTAGGKFFTVLYGTGKARVRLVAVAPPATGARMAIPNECAAEAAIHAARCNDRRITCLNSRDFVRHAVPIIPGASVAHDAQRRASAAAAGGSLGRRARQRIISSSQRICEGPRLDLCLVGGPSPQHEVCQMQAGLRSVQSTCSCVLRLNDEIRGNDA
jgi:hypothetical protein